MGNGWIINRTTILTLPPSTPQAARTVTVTQSRDALVEAALTQVLSEGDKVLESLDLTGDPHDALGVLIRSSWLLIPSQARSWRRLRHSLPLGRVQRTPRQSPPSASPT
jgi:hypothetical protein